MVNKTSALTEGYFGHNTGSFLVICLKFKQSRAGVDEERLISIEIHKSFAIGVLKFVAIL
jgi:hypothetical protein